MKLTTDLIAIVRTGCGLTIDAKSILTTDLIAIGNAGKGNIVLDLR
ncbi:MAG: hypothetical protein JXA06_12250 [Bacteroidetes bacterium]|nr:hypothetical protein [Bacteroidota bacterium]